MGRISGGGGGGLWWKFLSKGHKHSGSRWKTIQPSSDNKDVMETLLSNHDWLRSLRMASYGLLLYGPGSFAWYKYLDHALLKPTVENLLLKV
ncbi:Mpv17 [Thalictrum thalictroides]|uniref:Mpv17 n=1 Tax=Thalictrum thalictroides TaxID=46969 RepID=A0A7J6X1Y0_THATH|nr:Mpv17 [Thalictrum thalictroides]